jgi:hypothetical protein
MFIAMSRFEGTEVIPKHDAVGTPEQIRWLGTLVKAVMVLNVLDALFTLLWVRAGLATEANALMSNLVENHAVLFLVTKIGLVSLGSLLLWRQRTRPIAVIAIFVVFLAYYFVLLYHLEYMSVLIRNTLAG